MSVDKINEKVDAFFASNSGDADKVLDELKSQLPNDYDGKENKDILNAEKLSMNFSDKKLAKGRDKDAKEIAHNQLKPTMTHYPIKNCLRINVLFNFLDL